MRRIACCLVDGTNDDAADPDIPADLIARLPKKSTDNAVRNKADITGETRCY